MTSTKENTVLKAAKPRRDEEGNFLFRKEWLANYKVIDAPGTYKNITVANSNPYDPTEFGEEGSKKYIVNVKAVLATDLGEIANIINTEGEDGLVRASTLSDVLLTGSVWANEDNDFEGISIPRKRTQVEINVDYVENRDGEQVLRITDIYTQDAKEAKNVNMDALFA